MNVLFTSTITQNLIPYIKVLLEFLNLALHKKKSRSPTLFPIERKYAQLLTTFFILFTYGFAFPALYLYVLITISMTNVLDKLLVIYWYKPNPLNTDLLN